MSGESGAVGMGVLDAIMCDDTYKELRDALELDRHSRVLMFSTEGNTDPEKYRRVVWDLSLIHIFFSLLLYPAAAAYASSREYPFAVNSSLIFCT